MTYKCPKCGAVSEQPGNCPTDNIPMVASEQETASAEPQQTTEAQPSEEQTPTQKSE